MIAAFDMDTVKLWLDDNPETDATDENEKETIAEMRSHFDGLAKTIRSLLDNGAHIDATDEDGRTALMNVRTYESFLLIIEQGADIELKDKYGNTALIYAWERGLLEAAYLMMKLSQGHSAKTYKNFLLRQSAQGCDKWDPMEF